MPTKPTAPQTEDAALFREFEHTGDLGIEMDAPTRGELFRRAAIAIASLLVEMAGVAEIEQREIVVAIMRREIGVMTLSALVVTALLARAATVVH